jgi:O-succinylbenzoate synthase
LNQRQILFYIFIEPEFLANKDCTMDVPTKPGIGVEVNMKMLEKVTVKKAEFTM